VLRIVKVSVTLGFQHAMCMHHIVICGLSVSTVFLFSQFLINGMIFEKRHRKKYFFLFSPQLLPEPFFILKTNWERRDTNVY